MYDQIWYLFVAIGEGMVTRKLCIVKYVSYTQNQKISTFYANRIIQYFVIYFN